MRPRRTAVRRFVVAVALLGLSCTKKESKPEPNPEPKPAGSVEYPAEIDAPDPTRTTDLNKFRAYLDTFSRGTLHTRERRAICSGVAKAGECIDSVTIQAIGLSRDIWADSGPPRGRVIGLIRNLDSLKLTQMDSMRPARQAEYYIYIDRAASGHARWNLLEVPTGRSGIIRTHVQQEVHQCAEKKGYKWIASDVDFANCGEHPLTGMEAADLFTTSGARRLIRAIAQRLGAKPSNERGKWYGCGWGCCT